MRMADRYGWSLHEGVAAAVVAYLAARPRLHTPSLPIVCKLVDQIRWCFALPCSAHRPQAQEGWEAGPGREEAEHTREFM